jgi:hypothetical protein
MTLRSRLAIAGFLLAPALSELLPEPTPSAQSPGIKPGLWEMEQVLDIPDAPGGSFRSHWRHCVQEDVAKQGPIFSDLDRSRTAPQAGECRIENLQHPERGRVTYDIVCGKEENRIRVEYRFTETSFEGTSRMVNQRGNFSFQMKGRYVGPCKS